MDNESKDITLEFATFEDIYAELSKRYPQVVLAVLNKDGDLETHCTNIVTGLGILESYKLFLLQDLANDPRNNEE